MKVILGNNAAIFVLLILVSDNLPYGSVINYSVDLSVPREILKSQHMSIGRDSWSIVRKEL